jgi:hypothetical protein
VSGVSGGDVDFEAALLLPTASADDDDDDDDINNDGGNGGVVFETFRLSVYDVDVGAASALVTFICVLCSLRTQILGSICNFTHTGRCCCG